MYVFSYARISRFCSRDLDLDPMTLTYDHELDILKMNLHAVLRYVIGYCGYQFIQVIDCTSTKVLTTKVTTPKRNTEKKLILRKY